MSAQTGIFVSESILFQIIDSAKQQVQTTPQCVEEWFIMFYSCIMIRDAVSKLCFCV